MRKGRELMAASPIAKIIGGEIAPGTAYQTDEGCRQSNTNQSTNIKIMRISSGQLTPFRQGRSSVLLECFA
tara:strand:- start:54 stop:266 length:213 start_codon:yes stop_codon:yes gene_type:complete